MSLFATGLRKAAAVSDHGLLGASLQARPRVHGHRVGTPSFESRSDRSRRSCVRSHRARSPAAQVGPEIVGWAAALVSIQITEGDYTPLSQFDADAADPARFFDRLCDRIEVNRATCRDRERDRRVEDGRDSASDDEQASLADGWS